MGGGAGVAYTLTPRARAQESLLLSLFSGMRRDARRFNVAIYAFNGGPIRAISSNRISGARRAQPSKRPNGVRGWALPWPGGQHRLCSSSRHWRSDLCVLHQRQCVRPARIDDPGHGAVSLVSGKPDAHYLESGWTYRTSGTQGRRRTGRTRRPGRHVTRRSGAERAGVGPCDGGVGSHRYACEAATASVDSSDCRMPSCIDLASTL